ncbi:chromosome condensation protein [Amycolatopsis orientalis]|uniref:Phthiocerol/phthiodiolone dimycocerosyl transferase n=1 Tax=Amycolatopsis orientalis TaxID=31958 RepID=A0A193BV76_AMYOR|nr:chromosome condensation protein [Amycolatopsis orientalis]ANN16122.1 chromosome condensation protein [Amycolatopsis orientalis]
MTTTERALTVSETAFLLAGFGPVVVRTTFAGSFEPKVLEAAWQRLGLEYPLLRCGILGGLDGFRLSLRNELPEVADGAAGFGDDITRRLADGAISRLSLHETSDATALTLAVDHAVSDGRLVRNLLHDLLRIYTALSRDETLPAAPRPVFEPSLEELFEGQYEQGWPEPPSVLGDPLTLSGGPGKPPSGFGVHHLEFEPGPTAEIVAIARKNGISITGLLCGAVSSAIRARLPESDGSLPVTLRVPIDFRERLVPPLDALAQLCGALPCTVTVSVAADDEPLKVGLHATSELRAVLERDEPQRALLAQRHSPAPPPPTTIVVSNIGEAGDPVLPDGLRVTGSRFATTLNGPVPGMFVSTTSGRLTLDVVFDRAFHNAEEIAEVMASVEATLRAMTP